MKFSLILVSFIIGTFIIVGECGGYNGFLCSDNPRGKPLFFPCGLDCIHNHGALGGQCGDVRNGDFNCYCDGESPTGGGDASMHCLIPNDDDFRSICMADCICNHASYGGYCDWDRKACFCSGMGENRNNEFCEAKTSPEFSKLIYNYLGEKATPQIIFAIKTAIANMTLPIPPE